MNTKFLAGAGFLHGKASLTAAIPWDRARGTLFFSHNFLFKRKGLYAFLHLILYAEMLQDYVCAHFPH